MMRTNNTFSSDDDDSRDDCQIVLDDVTRDMTKMELRILCAKLKDKCNAGETKLKKVMLELHLLKSKGRNTKQKIRSDFRWDGDDANLADKITSWVKSFLFPRYKFLKNGWMGFRKMKRACLLLLGDTIIRAYRVMQITKTYGKE